MLALDERLGELLARKRRLDAQRNALNRMNDGSYDIWRDDVLVLLLEMMRQVRQTRNESVSTWTPTLPSA
jgi:hypothetical protein